MPMVNGKNIRICNSTDIKKAKLKVGDFVTEGTTG